MSRATLTFTVYKAVDGWRWRAQTRNNRIVADGGEAYTTQRSAIRAVGSFRGYMALGTSSMYIEKGKARAR